MGKKMIYATEEKLAKVNSENKELVRRYFVSKNMNLSEATIKAYKSDFNQLLCFILERYENMYILDFSTEDAADMIEDYIAFCTGVLENNERRIQRRLASLGSLYIYLRKKRKIDISPLEFIDRPKIGAGERPQIKQTFLTKEQVEQIRQELDKKKDLQLACFFEYALSTMLRVNAIVNTKIEQIDFDNNRVVDILEKEGYIVNAFPSERSMRLIKEWLDYRKQNNIEGEYLFINTTQKEIGKQISKSTVQSSWVKKIGELIGIPWLHCHDFRHSYSTLLYRANLPLEHISRLLSHKSTQTTLAHYIQTDFDGIQNEKTKFDI